TSACCEPFARCGAQRGRGIYGPSRSALSPKRGSVQRVFGARDNGNNSNGFEDVLLKPGAAEKRLAKRGLVAREPATAPHQKGMAKPSAQNWDNTPADSAFVLSVWLLTPSVAKRPSSSIKVDQAPFPAPGGDQSGPTTVK
ncbi:MAG TPA: hypothetical protein VHH73_08515, partial [Verrucomicrobiae bacterium]|nr:hypothetical protein [Verrucomicrobiae bacterium]